MKKLIPFFILTFVISQMTFSQEYGWTDISANIPGNPNLSDVYFVSDNEGWITSNYPEPIIFHTTDGGETFEVQTTEYGCNAIHMLNENEGYAGGASGFVYKTTDGGANWDFHGTMVATLADITFPPTGDTGYCCGINGNIYSISPSGVNKMTSNINGHLTSITFPVTSEEGWVCGGSVIRHYKNSVWNGDQNMPSGGYNAMFMLDNLNGWIVGDGGIIAQTENGWDWTEQINPDPENRTLIALFFLNENEGWAPNSGGQILHTTNGGENWNLVASGLTSNSLTGVHFTSATNGYVVGNGKTLLKYTDILGVGDYLVEIDFEIFPNPTKNSIQIKCSDFKTESGTIEILSINGKGLIEHQIKRGIKNIEIDLGNLKSGMYLCQITIDNRSSTKKIIIE